MSGLASRVKGFRDSFNKTVIEDRFSLIEKWLTEMLRDPRAKDEWMGTIMEEWVELCMADLIKEESARAEEEYERVQKEEEELLLKPWFARGVLSKLWEESEKEDEVEWRKEEVVGA